MRLAYFGDLVGTPGRRVLMQHLAAVRETHGADLIVANVENVADGSGVTPEQVKKLRDAGLDGMTLGDHAFRKQQIAATLREADDLIRPVNLPGRAWGRGWDAVDVPQFARRAAGGGVRGDGPAVHERGAGGRPVRGGGPAA